MTARVRQACEKQPPSKKQERLDERLWLLWRVILNIQSVHWPEEILEVIHLYPPH